MRYKLIVTLISSILRNLAYSINDHGSRLEVIQGQTSKVRIRFYIGRYSLDFRSILPRFRDIAAFVPVRPKLIFPPPLPFRLKFGVFPLFI